MVSVPWSSLSLFGTHSRRYITPATPPSSNKGSFGSLDITGCSVQLRIQSGDTIDDSGFCLEFRAIRTPIFWRALVFSFFFKSLGLEFSPSMLILVAIQRGNRLHRLYENHYRFLAQPNAVARGAKGTVFFTMNAECSMSQTTGRPLKNPTHRAAKNRYPSRQLLNVS